MLHSYMSIYLRTYMWPLFAQLYFLLISFSIIRHFETCLSKFIRYDNIKKAIQVTSNRRRLI